MKVVMNHPLSADTERSRGGRPQMSSLPDSTDLDATWEYLETGISRILAEPDIAFDVTSYMNFSAAIFNYLTCAKGIPKRSRKVYLLGKEMYDRLNACLGRHAREIAQRSKSHENEAFLQFYIEEWQRYSDASKLIDRLFQYFNRHWLRRELSEGKGVPLDTYTACLIQWHDGFYQEVSGELNATVRNLPQECRTGETIEPDEIKSIVDEIFRHNETSSNMSRRKQPEGDIIETTGMHTVASDGASGQRNMSSTERAAHLKVQLHEALKSGLGVDRDSFDGFMARVNTKF